MSSLKTQKPRRILLHKFKIETMLETYGLPQEILRKLLSFGTMLSQQYSKK